MVHKFHRGFTAQRKGVMGSLKRGESIRLTKSCPIAFYDSPRFSDPITPFLCRSKPL